MSAWCWQETVSEGCVSAWSTKSCTTGTDSRVYALWMPRDRGKAGSPIRLLDADVASSALQKRVWVAEQKVAVPGASHFGRSRRGSEASSVEPGADSRCSCIAEARAVGGGAEDLCSGRQRTAKRIDDAPQSLEEVVEMERSAPHEHKSHSSLRSTWGRFSAKGTVTGTRACLTDEALNITTVLAQIVVCKVLNWRH